MSRGWRVLIPALVAMAVLGGSSLAYAQTEVEIVRPMDGATVREVVRVVVPASSVPSGGYVSISIDGRRRSAIAKNVEADAFIYEWDTKSLDPDASLPLAQRQPREGEHAVTVQAFDSAGRTYGVPKTITVNVRNKASELMPPSGLMLSYTLKTGGKSKYRFTSVTNIKDVAGAQELAATIGQEIEGGELTVLQSIEDLRPDGTALVRQKMDGVLRLLQGGRSIPVTGVTAKATYKIEDRAGRTLGVIQSRASGTAFSVDLPNLPVSRVRIGDSWTDVDNVFQDVATGSNISMPCSSTLEGLEWQGGHPCAKIRTTFSGTRKLPESPILTEPVPMKGEKITYFAFQVGKVISSETTVLITAPMDRSTVASISEKLMSAYTAKFPSLNAPTGGDMSPGFQGMPNETPPGGESPPGGLYSPGASSGMTAAGPSSDRVNVTLEVKQKVELVH